MKRNLLLAVSIVSCVGGSLLSEKDAAASVKDLDVGLGSREWVILQTTSNGEDHTLRIHNQAKPCYLFNDSQIDGEDGTDDLWWQQISAGTSDPHVYKIAGVSVSSPLWVDISGTFKAATGVAGCDGGDSGGAGPDLTFQVHVPPCGEDMAKIWSLKFGKHQGVSSTAPAIDGWCVDASKILQVKDYDDDVSCCVIFKRHGLVMGDQFANVTDVNLADVRLYLINTLQVDVYVVSSLLLVPAGGGAPVEHAGKTFFLGQKVLIRSASGSGSVLAHEWGHALGLYIAGHSNNPLHLMHDAPSGRGLTEAECTTFHP